MSVLHLAPAALHISDALELPIRGSNISRLVTPSQTLPACPCCGALALEGLWRDPFDLEHDCRCFLEQTEHYEAGVQRLWRARTNRAAYLESLPKRYQTYTLEALRSHAGNRDAFEAVQQLELGSSLYLHGTPGNGKTHLAVALGFRLLEAGSVTFWNTARLYAVLRDCVAGNAPKPNLLSPKTLILDDLGKVKASEFVYETIYAALEGRWSEGRTTVFTANHKPGIVADRLTPASLDRESANAILSRLVAGRVIEVRGRDEREGRS